MISDVQQFAVQMGVDIELLEPTVEPTEDEEMSTAIELLKKPASYLMVSNFYNSTYNVQTKKKKQELRVYIKAYLR